LNPLFAPPPPPPHRRRRRRPSFPPLLPPLPRPHFVLSLFLARGPLFFQGDMVAEALRAQILSMEDDLKGKEEQLQVER